jgi:GT2 family glycosyltransferase
MIDLSIIILNYNTKDMTLKCLESIKSSDFNKQKLEIILIDNHSSDDSLKAFKQFGQNNKDLKFNFINNQSNLGFGAGNNRGIRQAKGKYILLLNSDVILEKDTLLKQLNFMQKNQKYDVSTCFLKLENGRMDPACHRGFPTPWASLSYFSRLEKIFPKTKLFGGYHQGWKNLETAHQVDAISGAFFFAHKKVFDKVGLFDEGFFMYAEDLDLCLRVKNAGFTIAFNPKVKALHLKGTSGRNKKQGKDLKSQYYFWDTMQLFYKKHYYQKYFKPLSWLIIKVIDIKKKKYADI